MIIDFKKYSSVKIGGEFEVEVLEQIREFDGFLIGGANNLLISPKPKNIGILSDNFNFIENLTSNLIYVTRDLLKDTFFYVMCRRFFKNDRQGLYFF